MASGVLTRFSTHLTVRPTLWPSWPVYKLDLDIIMKTIETNFRDFETVATRAQGSPFAWLCDTVIKYLMNLNKSLQSGFRNWRYYYILTSAWASSLSWWGNLRSTPPVWMSRDSPRIQLAITEHSICQPGRPCNTSCIHMCIYKYSYNSSVNWSFNGGQNLKIVIYLQKDTYSRSI